ncbi:MAG: hypothetical protein U0176_09355 [Bacteroidia bacterium]
MATMGGGSSSHAVAPGEEFLGIHGPDFHVHQVAAAVHEEQGRVGIHIVGLRQLQALAFFHVEGDIDEVLVEEGGDLRVGECGAGHPLAGSAPGGEGVQEDQFVGGFGLGEGLGPGALLEADFLRTQRGEGQEEPAEDDNCPFHKRRN